MSTTLLPSTHSRLFTDRYLDKKMGQFSLLSIPDFDQKLAKIKQWQEGIRSQRIVKAKEEQLQDDFLKTFFGEVLGYSYSQDLTEWHLEREYKTVLDGTKADGALGYFRLGAKGKVEGDCRAVIELKDARSDLDKPQTRLNDRRTPVQQAFDYANSVGGNCRWVIVSNFLEIRLYYQTDRTRYERFEILQLGDEAVLKRFFFLLEHKRLLHPTQPSALEVLYQERQAQEAHITSQFYKDYQQARLDLFGHLHTQHPQIDPLHVLNKTQKLLDRLTFIWFCEDFQIIPAYTLRRLLESVKLDTFNPSATKVWDRVRGLFQAIHGGNSAAGIHAFNGGLFAPDPDLDALIIADSTLEHVIALEKYDFASDLNVNILGHIFEQSISDLEALKASITDQNYDAKQGKRKKDGVFYTPEYITRYIVEQAVGGYLEARKGELGFASLPDLEEADYASIQSTKAGIKANKKVQAHIAFWEAYRQVLAHIKVVDPACGSGAFLNQVFDYLYREGQKVNSELSRLKLGQLEVFNLNQQILSQNLYGVDLNPESVEITKLSLWLKTANNHDPLTSLDNNIRCGNSLVADPAYAGDRAFDWQAAFPEIFAQGGFDVVVGNPPYVRQELVPKPIKDYLTKNYDVSNGTADLYVYFFELGLRILQPKGKLGFISSNKFMRAQYGLPLRKHLANQAGLTQIIDFGELPVFEEAATFPAIYLMDAQPSQTLELQYASIQNLEFEDLTLEFESQCYFINSDMISSDAWILSRGNESHLLKKIRENGTPLSAYPDTYIYRGVLTGYNEAFIIDGATRNRLIQEHPSSAEIIKPFAVGDNVRRYRLEAEDKYLIFTRRGITIEQYPAIEAYLKTYKNRLMPKPKDHSGPWEGRKSGSYKWYEIQDSVDYWAAFEKPKIVYPVIGSSSRFMIDVDGFYLNDKCFIIYQSNPYLLGILNSKAVWFYLKSICSVLGDPNNGGRLELRGIYMQTVPIPSATEKDQAALGSLAEKNQELHQQRLAARRKGLAFLQAELGLGKVSQKLHSFDQLGWEAFAEELTKKHKVKLSLSQKEEWQEWLASKTQAIRKLDQEIAQLDHAIDQQVYRLYGLTSQEIGLIESSVV